MSADGPRSERPPTDAAVTAPGERPARIERPAPGEMVRRVNAEMVTVLGWGRAILLQFAHPLVGAGVAEHSSFRAGAVKSIARLHGTVSAMLALTFGSDHQALAAAAGINRIHDRVHGQLATPAGVFAAGTRYSAHDPELLRWVHATLVESVPLAYSRFVSPLSHAAREQYCRESATIAPLLGIPDRYLPDTWLDIRRYLDEMMGSGAIVVTDTARTLAGALLTPRWSVAAWPAFRVFRLATIGTLPPAIREGYRFGWTARDERALARWSRWIRVAHRWLPAWAHQWPQAR